MLTQTHPIYPTLSECMNVVIRMNVRSKKEYSKRFGEDSYLPAFPDRVYASEWVGWRHFLGKDNHTCYATMGEAKQAVRRLGIQSKTEYQRRYNEDKLLPSQPTRAYQSDWLHWADFLGIPDSRFYSTLAGAQQAALRLGTTTTTEYKRKYKGDPYLPANPAATYQGEWLGWDHFFLEKKSHFTVL